MIQIDLQPMLTTGIRRKIYSEATQTSLSVHCTMSSLFPVTRCALLVENRQNKSPHIGTCIIAAGEKINLNRILNNHEIIIFINGNVHRKLYTASNRGRTLPIWHINATITVRV